MVWNLTVTKMNSQRYNILELGDVILPACSLGLSSMGLHQEMKRLKLIQEMNCLKWLCATKIGKSFSMEKSQKCSSWHLKRLSKHQPTSQFSNTDLYFFLLITNFRLLTPSLFCPTYPSNFAVIYRINWKSQSPVLSFLFRYDISANLFQMKALHSNLNK